MLRQQTRVNVPRWLLTNPALLGSLKTYLQGALDQHVVENPSADIIVRNFYHGDWEKKYPPLMVLWDYYIATNQGDQNAAHSQSGQALGHVFKQMILEHPRMFDYDSGYRATYRLV